MTPEDLPQWALISIIEPSPHDAATAYVAATCYKLDDFQPYLFKTNDYGATWTKITDGIRADDFTRVIREDPGRRGLLFAGTETGLCVSFDDGTHWQDLRLNLPVVPIHDLCIKDSDLIAATHGRSFWVLDDITPLRQMSEEVQNSPVHLFEPRPVIRFMTVGGFSQAPASGLYYRKTDAFTITTIRKQKPNGETVDWNLDAGQNPPDGVIVVYYLREKPEQEVKLSFFDAQGNEIRSYSSEEKQDEQKVPGAEARAAYARLLRRLGEPRRRPENQLFPGINPVRIVNQVRVEAVNLRPQQRVAVVKLGDGPQRLAPGDGVRGRDLPGRGRRLGRGRIRARPSRGRILSDEQRRQPREQPCHKGGQGRSFRTADRRPPHPGPPGARPATPPCPRAPPRPPPWPEPARPRPRRRPPGSRGESLPVPRSR